jgi:hypothetical protein
MKFNKLTSIIIHIKRLSEVGRCGHSLELECHEKPMRIILQIASLPIAMPLFLFSPRVHAQTGSLTSRKDGHERWALLQTQPLREDR